MKLKKIIVRTESYFEDKEVFYGLPYEAGEQIPVCADMSLYHPVISGEY